MRQRLRSHLTYANLMVTILAFVVLGGGTALGAYVVSSNSQIGPNTISGHNHSGSVHANIISGTIDGQDVRDLHFTFLALKNGWQGNCFGGGAAEIAKSAEGVVYLRGSICLPSGSSFNPFKLPPGFAPTRTERLAVDQADSHTGRLTLNTNGQAVLASDPTDITAALTFTSLEGVSYTLPY